MWHANRLSGGAAHVGRWASPAPEGLRVGSGALSWQTVYLSECQDALKASSRSSNRETENGAPRAVAGRVVAGPDSLCSLPTSAKQGTAWPAVLPTRRVALLCASAAGGWLLAAGEVIGGAAKHVDPNARSAHSLSPPAARRCRRHRRLASPPHTGLWLGMRMACAMKSGMLRTPTAIAAAVACLPPPAHAPPAWRPR